MSIHPLDDSTRRDARRPMDSALLRVLGVAVLSVLFALIDCVGQAGSQSPFSAPLASDATRAQASAAAPADPFDVAAGAQALMRRN